MTDVNNSRSSCPAWGRCHLADEIQSTTNSADINIKRGTFVGFHQNLTQTFAGSRTRTDSEGTKAWLRARYSLYSRNCCNLFWCSADIWTALRVKQHLELVSWAGQEFQYLFQCLLFEKGVKMAGSLTLSALRKWWLSCRWRSSAWPWERSAVFCTWSLPCCWSIWWVCWKHEAAWSVCLLPEDKACVTVISVHVTQRKDRHFSFDHIHTAILLYIMHMNFFSRYFPL